MNWPPLATIAMARKEAPDCHRLTLRRGRASCLYRSVSRRYADHRRLLRVEKVKVRFGVHEITFVGDRGMIKGQQIEDLAQHGLHYITAMTKPQIEKLLPHRDYNWTSSIRRWPRCSRRRAYATCSGGILCVLKKSGTPGTRNWPRSRAGRQAAPLLTEHPRANAQGSPQKLVARAKLAHRSLGRIHL